MPPERIPSQSTNRFRLKIAEGYLARPSGISAREYAKGVGLHYATILSWVKRIDELRETEQPGSLTLGGSGRRSKSQPFEDKLLQQIKDKQRQGFNVTRAMIVAMAQELMPSFFEDKSENAALCWCGRFINRNRLTLRRVTTRGRTTRESTPVGTGAASQLEPRK